MINATQVRTVICGAIRIAGPIAIGILGVKAGIDIARESKLQAMLEEEPDANTIDVVKEFIPQFGAEECKYTAKKLAPLGIVIGVTITAGVIDKHFDMKALAQMTKLYSAAAISSVAYRNALVEVDEQKAIEVDESIEEKVKELDGKNDADVPFKDSVEVSKNNGEELFVDILTGRQFKSNIQDVKKALVEASKIYESEDEDIVQNPAIWPAKYLGLNELYKLLGISETYFGAQFGYVGTYDKDSSCWDYCGEHIGFELSPRKEGGYYICYKVAPLEGWYEI